MKVHLKALIVVLVIGAISAWAFQHFFLSRLNEATPVMSSLEMWERNGIPSFETKTLDGEFIKSESFKGKVVIVNFWASWCGPCVEEVPSLLKLVKAFNGEVQLVAISGDSSREDIDIFMKSFPEMKNPNVKLVWDEDRSLMKKFEVTRLPESLVTTKDLKLAKKLVGSIEWYNDDSKAYIKGLLETK